MAADPIRDPFRLAALAETNLLDTPPQESLDRYTRIARLALGAGVVLVSLVDDRRQFFSSHLGLGEPWATCRETPHSHSFCKHVVMDEQPLIVEDARHHPVVRDNLAIRDLSVVAYAGMPIRTSEGHILGSFCAIEVAPRAWSDVDLSLLRDLATAVSDEVELRRRVTRAQRAERELADVNRVLSEGHAAASSRTKSAAHDLRGPLSAITFGVESLRVHEASRMYPELGRLVNLVKRNVRHAAAILSDMDGAAQVGSADDRPRSTDLSRATREVCADFRERRSPIQIDDAGVVLWSIDIRCDGTSLRRCIENLLNNALRTARSRIVVSARRIGDEGVLVVEDDGAGLPDAEAYRAAWGVNERLQAQEGLSSSGLGLSIVKEIVERHGGHVEAGPSKLGGARFAIHLPISA